MRFLQTSSLIVFVCVCLLNIVLASSCTESKAISPMSANAVPGNGGPLDWAKHEAEIRHLLLKQKMKLPAVRKHMKEKHDFDATYAFLVFLCGLISANGPSERQYKFRFGGQKNLTGEEWEFVDHERRRRATLGKRTVVCLNDEPLPPERVDRGIARSRKNGSAGAKKRTTCKPPCSKFLSRGAIAYPKLKSGSRCRMQVWAGSLSEHHPRRLSTSGVWRCPTAQPSHSDRAFFSHLSTTQKMARLRWI